MGIVRASAPFLQTVRPAFPRKVRELLTFGYQSLSLRRIQSVNSNARSIYSNRKSAESKAYRLARSRLLRQALPKLIAYLNMVTDGDRIAVDFSDFRLVQVLMFAKQTKNGRALPIWFQIPPYGWTKEISQNTWVTQAIGEFVTAVGCRVTLVFDRGFAAPTIVQYKSPLVAAGLYPMWVYCNRLNLVGNTATRGKAHDKRQGERTMVSADQ